MSNLLGTIIGYVMSLLILCCGVAILICCISNELRDKVRELRPLWFLAIILLLFGVGTVGGSIYYNIDSLKAYDKVTNVYSVNESATFTLGIGKGYYYYNKTDSTKIISIGKIRIDNVNVITENNLEQPYLLEHKEVWEDREYFLYVPNDMRLIQYTSK